MERTMKTGLRMNRIRRMKMNGVMCWFWTCLERMLKSILASFLTVSVAIGFSLSVMFRKRAEKNLDLAKRWGEFTDTMLDHQKEMLEAEENNK